MSEKKEEGKEASKTAYLNEISKGISMYHYPFRVDRYPFVFCLPCEKLKKNGGAFTGDKRANVYSLFIPSALTDASSSLLDFENTELSSGKMLYPSLLLLDLFLKSVRNQYSGTSKTLSMDEKIPLYPDIHKKDVFVNEVVMTDQGPQKCTVYNGRYYQVPDPLPPPGPDDPPRVLEIVEKCVIVVEMLYKEGALPQAVDEEVRENLETYLNGAASEETDTNEPLTDLLFRQDPSEDAVPLIPHLINSSLAGFIIHFVGRDPLWSLEECIQKQINRSNSNTIDEAEEFAVHLQRNVTFKQAMEKEAISKSMANLHLLKNKAQLPESRVLIADIPAFNRAVNDYRRACGLEEYMPPAREDTGSQSQLADRQEYGGTAMAISYTTVPFLPWSPKEMLLFLKKVKVSPVQCIKRFYLKNGVSPYFYIPLPPLAFVPRSTVMLPYTVLPTHLATKDISSLRHGSRAVYSSLYKLKGVSFKELENLSSRIDIKMPDNTVNPGIIQPFEEVGATLGKDLMDHWRKLAESSSPEDYKRQHLLAAQETALSVFLQKCSQSSSCSSVLYKICQYLKEVQVGKQTLCTLQPVFHNQDHVGNYLWNLIWGMNFGSDMYAFHTSVAFDYTAACGLFLRSFVQFFHELFPLQIIHVSPPGLGKSYNNDQLLKRLLPGISSKVGNFTPKSWADSSVVDDYVMFFIDEAQDIFVGKFKAKPDDTSNQEQFVKTVLEGTVSEHRRQDRVNEGFITVKHDVIKRFFMFTNTNEAITLADMDENGVIQRETPRTYGQVYGNMDRTWLRVSKDAQDPLALAFSDATNKILQNAHACVSFVETLVQCKILYPPCLRLIDLTLKRLEISDAIFGPNSKPKHRFSGKIRTFYLAIVLSGAHHYLFHNPCSPFIQFYDKHGNFIAPPKRPRLASQMTEEERQEERETFVERAASLAESGDGPTPKGRKGGSVAYKPFDIRDLMDLQALMGPNITAAISAISAFVLEERNALQGAFVKILRTNGFDIEDLRYAVRLVDNHRVSYLNLWPGQPPEEILSRDPYCHLPYAKRPHDDPLRQEIYACAFTSGDINEPLPFETEEDNDFNAIIDDLAACARNADRDLDEYKRVKHDYLLKSSVSETEFNARLSKRAEQAKISEKAMDEARMSISTNVRLDAPTETSEGLYHMSGIKRVTSTMFPLDEMYLPHSFKNIRTPPNSSARRLGFGGVKRPYDSLPRKPILDFPMVFDQEYQEWRFTVDFLVMNFTDLSELTKAIAAVQRGAVHTPNHVKCVDATLLQSLSQRMTLEMPGLPPVKPDRVPIGMEELGWYMHPSNTSRYPKREMRVFEEISSDGEHSFFSLGEKAGEPASGKGDQDATKTPFRRGEKTPSKQFRPSGAFSKFTVREGKSPAQEGGQGANPIASAFTTASKTKFYRVSLYFLMLTPRAMAEILVKALTSIYTIPRPDIPLFCPDPNGPCSFLSSPVVPGNARNISMVSVSSDRKNMRAMLHNIKDMKENFRQMRKAAVEDLMNSGDDSDTDSGISDVETDEEDETDEDQPGSPFSGDRGQGPVTEEAKNEVNPYVNKQDEEVFLQALYNKSIGVSTKENYNINISQEMQQRALQLLEVMGSDASHITYTPGKGGIIDNMLNEALEKQKEINKSQGGKRRERMEAETSYAKEDPMEEDKARRSQYEEFRDGLKKPRTTPDRSRRHREDTFMDDY